MENPEKYIESLSRKKDLFEKNPICKSYGLPIKKWEEVDFYEGKIYHRYFSPKLEMAIDSSAKRASVNTSVQFY